MTHTKHVALAFSARGEMLDGPDHVLAGIHEDDGAFETACGLRLSSKHEPHSSEGWWEYSDLPPSPPLCGDCFIGACHDCGRPIAASDRKYTIEIEPGEVHGYFCAGCSGDLTLDDGYPASQEVPQ